GAELCPARGMSIQVGKYSHSSRSTWQEAGQSRHMHAPVSLVVSAFAPVADVTSTLTPCLQAADAGATRLLLADLGNGRNRLGGSALAQAYARLGSTPPDLDEPAQLWQFFHVIQRLASVGRLLAYHDRSDGGLFACLAEMAFAGRVGLHITLDALGNDAIAALFAEELGAVLQVTAAEAPAVVAELRAAGVAAHDIGSVTTSQELVFEHGGRRVFADERVNLQRRWSETSYRLQALRGAPQCAQQEYDSLLDVDDPGLPARVTFDASEDVAAPWVNSARPQVAILREQGSHGHAEMAWAFTQAGFDAVDVHMSELLAGTQS